MKNKIVLALSLFAIGLLSIVDWIVFTTKSDQLSFLQIKANYVARLPSFLQNIYTNHAGILALVLIFCFVYSGITLMRTSNKFYHIIGGTAFVLAMWESWTLL